MGLSKLKRWLIVRFIKDRVDNLRGKGKETGMGKVLKFFDGWKLVIATLAIFGSRVYDAFHNGHTGDIVGSVLAAMGWAPPDGLVSPQAIGGAVTGALALWAVIHKVMVAQAQIRAGSSVAGALTTEGYVSKYIKDGKE
jgi:hypothetical protein